VIHAVEYRNTNFQEIAKVTENDEELKEVIKLYERGWPISKKQVPENMRQYWNLRDSISVENGVVFYESRIVVPKELRSKVLRLVHEGHNGVTKTILRAKQLVYWNAMDNEIKHFVDKCYTCAKYRNANVKESLISHVAPTLPFEMVSCDIFTFGGNDYLVVIDHYSKWLEIC